MESALIDLNVMHVMQVFPRKVPKSKKHVNLHIEDSTLHYYNQQKIKESNLMIFLQQFQPKASV